MTNGCVDSYHRTRNQMPIFFHFCSYGFAHGLGSFLPTTVSYWRLVGFPETITQSTKQSSYNTRSVCSSEERKGTRGGTGNQRSIAASTMSVVIRSMQLGTKSHDGL